MNINGVEYLAKQTKETQTKYQEYVRSINESKILSELLEKYPDLIVSRSWNQNKFESSMVNGLADKYHQKYPHNDPNDPLHNQFIIYPYVESEVSATNVYSSPSSFNIGYYHEGYPVPYPEWKELLRKHNVSEQLIETIQNHFKKEIEEAIEIYQSALEKI